MLIGIIVCFVMALAATWLAGIQHIIGAPLLGLRYHTCQLYAAEVLGSI